MKSVDALFTRSFDDDTYNCAHFVVDAARYLFELDYKDEFLPVMTSVDKRQIVLSSRTSFKRVQRAMDGDVVMLRAGRQTPHVGLFVRGKILHIQRSGVQLQPLHVVEVGFSAVRFYRHATSPHL